MKSLSLMVLVSLMMLVSAGCHYAQNRLDDFCDIFSLGIGGTVARDTPLPPALGLYVEVTEGLHLGGMLYKGYMLELDRRGAAVTRVNEDTRWGIGPFHKWERDETYVAGNRYKSDRMQRWEDRMMARQVKALAFDGKLHPKAVKVPAKRMRFHDVKLGPLPRGYQDWGFVSIDLAICEPFLLHAGVRMRVGVDFSQFADFFVGIFGLDMYGDDARPGEYELHMQSSREDGGDAEGDDDL